MKKIGKYKWAFIATVAAFVATATVFVGCTRKGTPSQPVSTLLVIPTTEPDDSPSSLSLTTSPSSPVGLSSITLVLDSQAELLVTDPQGRRTGTDPHTGITYDEIPDALYYVEALSDITGEITGPYHPFKVFESYAPLDGNYSIQVIESGSGPYSLDILTYDENGDSASLTVSGQIETNSVDEYIMNYSSAPGANVSIVSVNSTRP